MQNQKKKWRYNNIGSFDVNYDTGEQYWSPQLRTMLGVSRDTPPGLHLFLQRLHPDDRRRFAIVANRVWLAQFPTETTITVRIVDEGVGIRVLDIAAYTTLRGGGKHDAVRTFGLVVDVTEQALLKREADAIAA